MGPESVLLRAMTSSVKIGLQEGFVARQDHCNVQEKDRRDQATHMSIMESAYSIKMIRGLIIASSRVHPQSRGHRVQTNLRGDVNSS
jgi:hypothetical protein